MKKLYLLVDDIQKEEVDIIMANNDRAAITHINRLLQKMPGDMEFSLYCIGTSFIDDSKDNDNVGFTKSEEQFYKHIWSFPNDLVMNEKDVEYNIQKESTEIENEEIEKEE